MQPIPNNLQPLSPAEAREIQNTLRSKVILRPFRKKRFLIAGTDVSFDDERGMAVAGIVVLKVPGLETVDEAWAEARLDFPYIPGFLSFREIPALLRAFENLKTRLDCVMADGQGLAHPRRFGLACHLGLTLGMPTLGCAKSRLTGECEEPEQKKGSSSPLTIEDEPVGAVLRTRDGVSPIYVSPGHLFDIGSAVRVALECAVTRIPEPTRRAHMLVTGVKKRIFSG
jgi:deoxyribonuclease V